MTTEELADAYGEVSDYLDMLVATPRPETGITKREAEAVRLGLIAGFCEAEWIARGKRDTGAFRITYAAKLLSSVLDTYREHIEMHVEKEEGEEQ